MKKISKLLVSIGLLATATTGCTDLDVDITSQYTEYPDILLYLLNKTEF